MSDIKFNNKWFKSGLDVLNEVLYGKWKFIIIWNLMDKPLRFSDLRKNIPAITDRMLSLQLKELEENNFVERIVTEATPPKIDYKLTQKALEIMPALKSLEKYGRGLAQPEVKKAKTTKKVILPLSEDEESFFDKLS
ncbi:helix-turn-helix domain-containing protein [uncultured Cytophaga sp.]|uniref:winged helix-turn-helix transcriptional regulator n=1 Tax=uncultured Cytophaga sp. TaxID=160238 RepID=UPI002607B388|nr:helix-turn-helix domain-containing protein [uncultured Cytophaga sp.]